MRGSRGCSPDSDGLRRARERRRADARTLADCRSVGPEGAVGPMGLRRISATHASLRGIGAALVLVSLAYLGTRAALPFMRGGVLTDQWGSIARENAVVDVDQGAFFGTHGDATEALPAGVDTCGLRGPIGGPCGCDYASVNRLNRDHVHPIVSSLVRTPFFRYFKVDLHCDCPLWPDDSMCAMPTCSVDECCAQDPVPEALLLLDKQQCGSRGVAMGEGAVDRAVEAGMRGERGTTGAAGLYWRGTVNPWHQDPKDESECTYVNLIRNPERYTGYRGEHAHRVWRTVYALGCLGEGGGTAEAAAAAVGARAAVGMEDWGSRCGEDGVVLMRLLSGMHASIAAHIAKGYPVDGGAGDAWGENVGLFLDRLGRPEHRGRLENLYFTYLFTLRAVVKAGPVLRSAEIQSGFTEDDERAMEMLGRLLGDPGAMGACPVPFDETLVFGGEGAGERKSRVQSAFRAITRAMDCVGCEKCKLWGKLQVLGMATALKVNFHESEGGELSLDRNEMVALVNFLGRLSSSLEAVRHFSPHVLDVEARGGWAHVPSTGTWDPVLGEVALPKPTLTTINPSAAKADAWGAGAGRTSVF